MAKHTFKILQCLESYLKKVHEKCILLLPTNILSVFDHFVGLAFKGLTLPCIALKYGQTYFKNLAVLIVLLKRVQEIEIQKYKIEKFKI